MTHRSLLVSGLLVAVVVAGLTGCSSSQTDAQRALPLLAEPAGDQDALPDVIGFESRADLSSSRFVGDSGKARYWAAVDSSGKVCLVAIRAADHPSVAAACVSPTAFVNGGVSIELDLSGESATLAPETIVSGVSSPARVVSTHLYVDQRDFPVAGRLFVDRGSYFDTKGKENNRQLGVVYSDDDLLRFVRNVYAVLLTRGIRGTYVFVRDAGLREYLARFIPSRTH